MKGRQVELFKVHTNWHQDAGEDGACEQYETYEIGKSGWPDVGVVCGITRIDGGVKVTYEDQSSVEKYNIDSLFERVVISRDQVLVLDEGFVDEVSLFGFTARVEALTGDDTYIQVGDVIYGAQEVRENGNFLAGRIHTYIIQG